MFWFFRYVIEKKEKLATRWVKSAKTPGPECKYRVTDVDEGTEVQFQVRAENEAGVGHPSEPTMILMIEDATSMFLSVALLIQPQSYDNIKNALQIPHLTNGLFFFF